MLEIKEFIAIMGLFVTVGIAYWGVLRWTISKIETRHSEAMNYTDNTYRVASENISRVDHRVNEVRDEYVKRSDLDRDFKALEKQIDAMNRAIAEGRSETNHRLDRMLMLLGKVISNSQSNHSDYD